MSEKQLIQILKETPKPSVSALRKVKSSHSGNLAQLEETINRLWSMYEEQLKRNVDLMSYINELQQNLETSRRQLTAAEVVSVPVHIQPKNSDIETANIKDAGAGGLTYHQLRSYTEYFGQLYISPFRRVEGLHNLIYILHNLNLLGGKATQQQLFTKSALADVTGYRIISKLKELGMVKTSGSRFNSYYEINSIGRKFLDFKLTHKAACDHITRYSLMRNPMPGEFPE